MKNEKVLTTGEKLIYGEGKQKFYDAFPSRI